MDWAVRKRSQLLRFLMLVGSVLTLAYLVIGGDPFSVRAAMVLVDVVLVPLAYFGVRAVLGLQLKMHGMSRFVRQACRFFFYFFGIGAGAGLVMTVIGLAERSPWPPSFWFTAFGSLGALDTYARGKKHESAAGGEGPVPM